MKSIFRFFLLIAALFTVLSASAQRINPSTQIKRAAGLDTILISELDGDFIYKPATYLNSLLSVVILDSVAPSDPPGDQSWIHIDTIGNAGVYVFNGDEWIGPIVFTIQGDGPPSDAPETWQSWVYVDTDTGDLYVWDGDSWEIVGGANLQFANGLTLTGDTIVRLGGDLTQNTSFNGKALRSVTFDSISSLTVRARTGGASTGYTLFQVSNVASVGGNLTSFVPSDLTVFGRLHVSPNVASYLRQSNDEIRGEIRATDHSAELVYVTLDGESSTDVYRIYVDSAGSFMTNLPAATTAATKILYQDPITDEVYQGNVPVVVTDSVTTGVYATYSYLNGGNEVTATRTDGNVEVVVPAGVTLISLKVTGDDDANDGSGNFTVEFEGQGLVGNRSIATLNIPATQKIDLSAQGLGAPSTGNPYPVDDDDTVQVQVVGVGTSGAPGITLRAVGLTAAYDDWQLIFNF